MSATIPSEIFYNKKKTVCEVHNNKILDRNTHAVKRVISQTLESVLVSIDGQ